MAGLETDQRQATHHGSHEREPHHALQHRRGWLGSGAAAVAAYPGEHDAGGVLVERIDWPCDHLAWPGRHRDCGHRGGPAGGTVRATVYCLGRREKYLWDG